MWYPELKGTALDAYRTMVAKLRTKASSELRLPPDKIVVRDLRPEDYGASSADAYVGVADGSWTNLVNEQTIGDNRFIGVCGFYCTGTVASAGGTSAGPVSALTQLRVTREGSKVRYWYVQPIFHFESKTGWTDDPFTVDQNTTITVEGWNRLTSSMANWGLLGAVAEKRGVLINP